VSSSGHLILVPALLGWPYSSLDPELRKGFEVALHAGTGTALLWILRDEAAELLSDIDRRGPGVAAAFLPPALVGLVLGRWIEERLGTPRQIAWTQVVAGLALAVADRSATARRYEAAGALDHLLLGLAQAGALVPGVSRSGATLTVARLRRLDRPAANRLSRDVALLTVLGATSLIGARLAGGGLPRRLYAPFAVGAGSALLSTALSRGLLERVGRARSLGPIGAYRVVMGAGALAALRARRLAHRTGTRG
jgi:undecaprenyl-diphosphatase